MRLRITLPLSLLVFLIAAASSADMRPIKKLRPGIPPYAVAEKIARHNDQVVASRLADEPLKLPGTPHMTWLADCDARVQATLFYPDPVDTIYAVRNPGNQFSLSAGAIDYGVNELHTPVLLITGNTNSDSLRLFAKGYTHLGADLRHDLDSLRLSLGTNAPGSGAMARPETVLVEKNVDFQVATAMKRYAQRIESGRLVVIGAVIDLNNRYGYGLNRLIIININSEIDPERLRAMHHLIRLDKRLLGLVGRKPWAEENTESLATPPSRKAPSKKSSKKKSALKK
ncbi:carbonic anhydrase [Thiovibrio frasassiensis]|uniref:Carbonic anhydrase n=1 Tax=Thiovibrio frasassiensis TaxID=2984131 RepID=A0A9X4MFB0_9BACT|nr:carbonic anhydrase [Thiovibrio frasassiensis]MDG4476474.1 carbonic anhydrase [Thiovibrio frasassiensis]